MLQEKQIRWLAVAVGALVLCVSAPSFAAKRARRARTAAKASQSLKHSVALPHYLRMRVSSQQIYNESGGFQIYDPQEDSGSVRVAGEKRGNLFVDFQAPFVRLTANKYRVQNLGISLSGHASISSKVGNQPWSISSDQLELSWTVEGLPNDTVIEAQTYAPDFIEVTPVATASGAEVPPDAKPSSFAGHRIPVAAEPVSILLKLLQDEASSYGRFVGGAYEDGAPFSVTRYVVNFGGSSFGDDAGSSSEDGQLTYDQSKRVLFLEARTRNAWVNKSTLLQLTLADVTIDQLGTLLYEGHGAISYDKATIADELAKLGAKVVKRSFTSSAL